MDKKTKNILGYLFWAAVAAVLVYFCLRAVDWEQFGTAMRECRWEYVILSMLLGVLSFFIRGLRWRMLLKPFDPEISVATCFNAYNICNVVNLALPRAGELARMAFVVKDSSRDADGKRRMTADEALGTIVVERVWDMVFMFMVAVLLLVLKWDDFGVYLSDLLLAIGQRKGLWLLIGVVLLLVPITVFLSWRLSSRGGIWGKIWGFIAGIGKGIVSFRRMEKGWLFLLYTLLIWTLYWMMSAAILWALKGMDAFSSLTLTDALFLSVVGSLSSMLPVPGGFGAYHGLVAGALKSLWDIPMGTGMVYATLNHESQVLTQAVCGLASYIYETFFRRKK